MTRYDPRRRRAIPTAALALLLASPVAAQPDAVQTTDDPEASAAVGGDASAPLPMGPEGPPMPVSLSISGGVSLGAYEAGVSWATVRYLRRWGDDRSVRPDPGDGPVALVGITGASAGAINALLTALTWCSSPEALGPADDNLPRNLWLGVGFDGLLPPEGDPFLAFDGAMTRTAFTGGLEQLQAALDRTDYRPHCRVPVAFTVTRGVPWEQRVSGLTVANQRFAVPLELVVDAEGRVWFRNHVEVLRNESMLGQYLFLAERSGEAEQRARGRTGGTPPTRVVPADLVLQAMLASSAFPLAFSPVPLVTCLPTDRCPIEHPPPATGEFGWLGCGDRDTCDDFSALTCEGLSDPGQPLAPCTSRFVDGGFFDNVPLGVAMAQAELSSPDAPQRRPVDYLYFDPDVRRLDEDRDRIDDLGDRGFARMTAILGDVATTARSYELSTVLRMARFNRPLGWYVRRFGELITRAAETDGDAPADAAPPATPLAACLAALDADAEGCARLPLACMALAEFEPEPTGSGGRCLPADPAAVSAALRRLGRRLDCNARRTAHYPRLMRRLPPIVRHVERWFGEVVQCRARSGVETMLQARMVRDHQEARDMVALMAESVAPARTLTLPRRFAELAAGQVRNFGAFFDAPLRRHDYAVGIYDAIGGIAAWHCITRASIVGERLDLAALWACVQTEAPAVRAALEVEQVPELAAIIDALGALEAAAMARELERPLPDVDPRARCPGADDGPCAVQRALVRCAAGDGRLRLRMAGGQACMGQPDMDDFVAALSAEGYRPRSRYMQRLLNDRLWWTAMVERLVARLADIEASEARRADRRVAGDPTNSEVHRVARDDALGTRKGFLAAGTALRAAFPGPPGIDIDPSTIPDDQGFHWARLLPYRLGIGLIHGGITTGWEPRFGGQTASFRLGLEPLSWEGSERGFASQISAMLALRPWSSVAWGALSLGPRLVRPWEQDEGFGVGALLAIDMLADRLRVELSLPLTVFGGEEQPEPAAVPLLLTVSLLDLPGLVWLAAQ